MIGSHSHTPPRRMQQCSCVDCGVAWEREIVPGPRPARCASCFAKDPRRVRRAEYARQHADRIVASRKRYEAEHKDRMDARRAEWERENREAVNARRAAWRDERRDAVNEVERARRRRVAAADPDGAYLRKKRHHLRSVYGLELGEYDAMLARQKNGCAVCGDAPERPYSLHVDHDHDTGVVRGLLCGRCNVMLGMARDEPLILFAGIEYLEGRL